MKAKLLCSVALALFVSVRFSAAGSSADDGFVVHEWGTFTSFQAADGVPLSWKPLVTSALPRFVYDWVRPGLGRYNLTIMGGKGSLTSLQRMETPVVYFYSDKELTADLSVQFPRGLITEWYPQALEVGPSVGPTPDKKITNSLIHWPNIHILPPNAAPSPSLAVDTNGTHYFAARETDANLLELDSMATNHPSPQSEKFLFYRGAGNFPTPLRVTMKSDNTITLANTGKEPLTHLFILDVTNHAGSFLYVAELKPGEEKTLARPDLSHALSPMELPVAISKAMCQSLIQEGLYPREAAAMVNTWKSSWFAEDGTRVFYLLPRAWTDRTLPMTLSPQPRELTRAMVGRAEVLTPAIEGKLVAQLEEFRQGNSTAAAELRLIAQSLGRFAEPAFYRALAKIKSRPEEQSKLASVFFNHRQSSTFE